MLKRLFFMLCLLTPAIVLAQSDVEQEFRERLQLFSSRNRTIECQFEQTKRVKNLKEEVKSGGDFYYDNSGLLALVYSEPEGDKIVMRGEEFSITSAGKTFESGADDNPMLGQIATMMRGCMSGDLEQFDSGWELSIAKVEGGYRASLIPTNRRIKRYISAIVMQFNGADMTLDELHMAEASGGGTTYLFRDKQLNGAIDSKVFNN